MSTGSENIGMLDNFKHKLKNAQWHMGGKEETGDWIREEKAQSSRRTKVQERMTG